MSDLLTLRARLVWFAALVVLAACSAGPTPTSAPAGALPCSATPSTTAGAANGWRLLIDFPVQGDVIVSSVVGTGSCFVAVGSVFDPDAACLDDEYQGRIWASADGVAWTARPADTFAKTRLTQVLEFGGALYIVGVTGAGDSEGGCPAPDQPGMNFWRSPDNGASWQRLTQSVALAGASILQVVVAGEDLIAVGYQQGTDVDQAMTWTSPDATSWTAAEQPPNAPGLSIAAARNNVVIGFGGDQDYPLAWISRDLGANWYEESIDVEPAPTEDLTIAVASVVATNGGFVAVGEGCCMGTGELVPIVFNSTDGTQWIGHPQPAEHAESMARVVGLPAGLLAVGIETFVTETADTSRLGGRSWISTDGAAWRRGPDFAELGNGYVTAVAAGAGGVVVAGLAETGLRVWFAPYGAFEDGASN